jgi:hypothetical protein
VSRSGGDQPIDPSARAKSPSAVERRARPGGPQSLAGPTPQTTRAHPTTTLAPWTAAVQPPARRGVTQLRAP